MNGPRPAGGLSSGSGFIPALMATGALAGFALLGLLVCLLIPAGSSGTLVVAAAGAVVAGIFCLKHPQTLLLSFLFLCMVVPHELEEVSLPLGFMHLYLQDAVFVTLSAAAVIRLLSHGFADFPRLPFTRLMVLYHLFGIWALYVGLRISHHSYDAAFGDFRRAFFYFAMYYFCLIFLRGEQHINRLFHVLLAGSIAAILRGVLQAATGEFITRRFSDAAHVLTHFEVTFSTFAIYVALAHITKGSAKRWLWGLVALAGILIVLIANFRTCWVGLAAGLLCFFLLLPWPKMRAFAAVAGVLVCVGALLTGLLWHLPITENHSTLGENIEAKASLQQLTDDPNIAWRLDSYRNALDLWRQHPVRGQGLGVELEFSTATSTGGAMLATGHRVHNSYLWYLMCLGVTGFGLFAWLHLSFFRKLRSGIRTCSEDRTAIYLRAAQAFYVTIMVSACFDVYLESAPPVTLVGALMGATLLMIRQQQELATRPNLTAYRATQALPV